MKGATMQWKIGLRVLGYTVVGLIVIATLMLSYFLLSPDYTMLNPENDAMRPTFTKADIAVFKIGTAAKIKPGEVISFTYQDPNQAKAAVTARVVSLDGNVLVTKRDDSADIQSWEMMNVQVKGRYLFKLPFLGNVVRLITGADSRYYLIGLGLLALLAISVLEFARAMKAKKRGGAEHQPDTP
jgi:hypothetical protein